MKCGEGETNMELAVSYDDQGRIVTIFDPEKLRSNRWSLKYSPAEGEMHHILEVPSEFEGRPFRDLPELLRVNVGGAHPRLEPKA
jgi:YD repeat-containing protein